MLCKWISVPLVALTLVSCSKKASDDYEFERKEYTLLDQKIEFVLISNEQEFNKLAKEFVGPDQNADNLGAFSRLRLNRADENLAGSECIVYIKDPDWVYEPEYIGHEITHCLFGDWHPKQNNRG